MPFIRIHKGRRAHGGPRPSTAAASASAATAATSSAAQSAAWAALATTRALCPVPMGQSARVLCIAYNVPESSLRRICPSAASGRLTIDDILPALLKRSHAICQEHMSSSLPWVGGEAAVAGAAAAAAASAAECAASPQSVRRWAFRDSTALLCKGAAPRDPNALRAYQAESLGRLLDAQGRSLSGNAKLPCGAGKTLLALWHAVRLETYTLVLTNSNMSTLQWVSQLRRHFELPAAAVMALGAGLSGADGRKEILRLVRDRPMFVICTYQTATLHGAPGSAVGLLRALPHGLMILDEAQTSVASCFSRALAIPCASVLAISATFKRQDQRIELLQRAVGPLLVDVDRGLLVTGGFLAEVGRVELHVPAPASGGASLHAHKVAALFTILERHLLAGGDKILVFCDRLRHVATVHRLLMGYVAGRAPVLGPLTMHTPAGQRQAQLEAFRGAERAVLCLSRVADAAVDLPGANVLVQVSCATASHNQEMQRTGRVQRPGRGGVHVAYTLVTRGSREVRHAESRRQCMEAEGYVTKQFELTCARGLLEAAPLQLRLAVEVVGGEGDEEEGEGGAWEGDEEEGGEEGRRGEVALADDDNPFTGPDGN